MANKKSGRWVLYILVVIIGWLGFQSLPVDHALPAIAAVDSPASAPALKADDEAIQPMVVENDVAPTLGFEVKPLYPQQHVFDDKICSFGDIRANFQDKHVEAIGRLDDRYQVNHYVLSPYLELNLYATELSEYLEQTLITRLALLHQDYIKMLGTSAQTAMVLHLVIAPNREEYHHQLSFYSPRQSPTLGVYFGGINMAYIDYQYSDDKALKTAIHESVHALNAHILGKTPRMFNEGMAEFYEAMTLVDGEISIEIEQSDLMKAPYPLMQFFDYQQWPYLDVSRLYYSSWSWVTFMRSSAQGRRALIYFMHKERNKPCTAFSADQSYEILQYKYNDLELDFEEWPH